MIKIYDKSPEVNQSHYLSAGFYWNTNGNRVWHSAYGFPKVGFNVFYNYMGNDSILGRSVGLCPSMIIQYRALKKWGLYVKLGSGFAYFNKPYNRVTNNDNEVIGSHITNITNIGAGAFIKVAKNVSMHAGYSVFHFSTGHVKIPNYGFNDLTWNIGAEYITGKVQYRTCNYKPSKDPFLFNLRLSIGWHELSGTDCPNGGPIYPIYTITPFISKRLGKINNIRIGLGAKYFTSYNNFMKSEDYFRGKENLKSWVFSAIIGNEWSIGKIGFLFEPAIKFYNPFYEEILLEMSQDDKKNMKIKRWISIKSGFAYYINGYSNNPQRKASIGIYINTNKTQADFVDLALNYTF